MKRLFAQAAVVARRDFMATVGTPTFLVFLLAPLFMFGLAVASGTGVASMASKTAESTRITAIADARLAKALIAADARLRPLYRTDEAPPPLSIATPAANPGTQAAAEFAKGNSTAVMFGEPKSPHILHGPRSERHARYLGELAEQVLRGERAGLSADARFSTPIIVESKKPNSGKAARQASGFGAVLGIFMLTLMLAGQAVGMLAEEKTNKVIEILAAAVPLESVFLGKLVGMFGAAMVFVGFWGSLLGAFALAAPDVSGFAQFQPAIGVPAFMVLAAIYFAMAYMLLGAVFLGVGGLAGSMREIQMMSLPITIFQMGMFGLASAAAASPGSGIATFAQIFPFSSPFAMAARGATDATLWPHLLAIGWQLLWVGLTIAFAARLFRIGVLKSGGGWRAVVGLR